MNVDLWNELRDHLGPRRAHGWYLDEAEMGWCFGLGGGCRLVVRVSDGAVRVYDADSDRETSFDTVARLAAVLPELERSHRGFSSDYRRILDSSLELPVEELAEHQSQLAAQDAALDTD